MGQDIALLPGELSETHWQPPVLFDMAQMEAALVALDTFETGLQYYIGDAMLFAREHFGEKWTQLIPEGKAEAWRQYLWVCERVAPDIRKKIPSYSHARTLAGVAPEDQSAVIQAVPAGCTTRELKTAVSARKAASKPEQKPKKKQWPVALLTWGRIKQYIEAQSFINDDTPIILNIGPDANNITLYDGPGQNTTIYAEGWHDDDFAATCSFNRNELL